MSDEKRIVITGATGNIGTRLVSALIADPAVGSVLGLSRRQPDRSVWSSDKVDFASIDLANSEEERIDEVLADADVVIHLAWILHPTHDAALTWATNVGGTQRLLAAITRVRVPALVHSSSLGAYSPGPKDATGVDESWPTDGWPTAAYTREKAYLERVLDTFEQTNPDTRVVRVRPAFALSRESATEQHRLFAGRLVPRGLLRSGMIPVVPDLPGMRVQVVHTVDLADVFRLAATGSAHGAFNVAADPVLDANALAELLHARTVRIPAKVVRAALAAGWRLHAVPSTPELFDALLRMPIMDTSRVRDELGWSPRHNSVETVAEFLEGVREHADAPTPPLAARSGTRQWRWPWERFRPAPRDRRYAGA